MPFGTSQLNKPTPSNIERNLKILVSISGAIIAALQGWTFLPNTVADIISGILGLIISICTVLTPFFGVQISNDEEVPASEITAMEKPNENK